MSGQSSCRPFDCLRKIVGLVSAQGRRWIGSETQLVNLGRALLRSLAIYAIDRRDDFLILAVQNFRQDEQDRHDEGATGSVGI